MAHGICRRCKGKGWRWTGQARVTCTCVWSTSPTADPVIEAGVTWVPVTEWMAGGRERWAGRR